MLHKTNCLKFNSTKIRIIFNYPAFFCKKMEFFTKWREKFAGARGSVARQWAKFAKWRDNFIKRRGKFAEWKVKFSKRRENFTGAMASVARQRGKFAEWKVKFAKLRAKFAGDFICWLRVILWPAIITVNNE